MSKLCMNCKHYFNLNSVCLLAKTEFISPVNGRLTTDYLPAIIERKNKFPGCGENGDLYKVETNKFNRFINNHPLLYLTGLCSIGFMIGSKIGSNLSYKEINK